jgi:ribosomal protein S18 acetylase RimI-like enzyme
VSDLEVRGLGPADRSWLEETLKRLWGSTSVVSRGRIHDAAALEGFACHEADRAVGLATYEIRGGECELVTLDAFTGGRGIGTRLLEAVAQVARERDCQRLWLITSNDNLRALRFYQRRGLRLIAVHRDAIDEARRLKPEIPQLGEHGIPIHDELELELRLG